MSQEIFIQVRFKEQTEVGEFNDCLYFSEVEYPAISQKFIDQEVASRVANWVDSIKNPPPSPQPTKAELIAEQQALLDQKSQIESQVADLAIQIASK